MRLRIAVALMFFGACAAFAQSSSDRPAAQSGFIFTVGFDGSFDNSGHVMDLGTSAGYKFNRHFQIDAGMPFYFLSSPGTGTLLVPHSPRPGTSGVKAPGCGNRPVALPALLDW